MRLPQPFRQGNLLAKFSEVFLDLIEEDASTKHNLPAE